MDVEKSVAKRKFCESDDFAQPREKKQSVSEPEKLNPGICTKLSLLKGRAFLSH